MKNKKNSDALDAEIKKTGAKSVADETTISGLPPDEKKVDDVLGGDELSKEESNGGDQLSSTGVMFGAGIIYVGR